MEIIATLTALKEMGIEVGQIGAYFAMYFMLKRDLLKATEKQFDKLIDAIKSLERAHNERLTTIETHIGLKK